jgi:hypothetical protein
MSTPAAPTLTALIQTTTVNTTTTRKLIGIYPKREQAYKAAREQNEYLCDQGLSGLAKFDVIKGGVETKVPAVHYRVQVIDVPYYDPEKCDENQLRADWTKNDEAGKIF